MTPAEKLEKIRDKMLAWSAYKALKGEDEDSKKMDRFCRDLDRIIKEME